ncbi:MarR family winged helix-turn-helix transcriptional regulator [Streptomyces chumphonensis]|uniref:MarR family winged helix-turn-helix transcriptional regulator n=1 Tax=Streptomyces chumphonensis TaxID=1214925 RepID=UPI003D7323E1
MTHSTARSSDAPTTGAAPRSAGPARFSAPAPGRAPAPPPEFTDEEVLRQPLGYWTGAASEAIVGFISDNLARGGVRQPHWWTLNRVREAPQALTRDEVVEVVGASRPYVDVSDLGTAVDELLERGLLAAGDAGALQLTPAGDALVDHLWQEVMTPTLAQIRAGMSDAEYVTVVRLLHRVIRNVGGDAGFRP